MILIMFARFIEYLYIYIYVNMKVIIKVINKEVAMLFSFEERKNIKERKGTNSNRRRVAVLIQIITGRKKKIAMEERYY